MWTERIKYIKNFDEMRKYLSDVDNFHDYRIGFISYKDDEISITIEEYITNEKISETTGLIWDFTFKNIESFKMDSDCVAGFWVSEVILENNEFIFGCTNGYIEIKTDTFECGVPDRKGGTKDD